MTRRRWIADEISGDRAIISGEHARHLTQVLRAKIGQDFDISTGGEVRRGRISQIAPDRVEFDLGECIASLAISAITVAASIFKFDRMEWAIEKCTELGVAKLIPIIAGRTEPHLAAAAPNRVERWQRVAHAAAEQSRRISPPEISAPVKLKELIASASGTRIVLSEVESDITLRAAVPETASLTLAFGPEGGWKDDELASFASAGWTSASLGATILRAETAIIAAVAVAASILQS